MTETNKVISIEGVRGHSVTEITAISDVEDGELLDTEISIDPFWIAGQHRDVFIEKLKNLVLEYYI